MAASRAASSSPCPGPSCGFASTTLPSASIVKINVTTPSTPASSASSGYSALAKSFSAGRLNSPLPCSGSSDVDASSSEADASDDSSEDDDFPDDVSCEPACSDWECSGACGDDS
jgi:hypothetical protein